MLIELLFDYCILNNYSNYYCTNIKKGSIRCLHYVICSCKFINYEVILSVSFTFDYIMLESNKIKFRYAFRVGHYFLDHGRIYRLENSTIRERIREIVNVTWHTDYHLFLLLFISFLLSQHRILSWNIRVAFTKYLNSWFSEISDSESLRNYTFIWHSSCESCFMSQRRSNIKQILSKLFFFHNCTNISLKYLVAFFSICRNIH